MGDRAVRAVARRHQRARGQERRQQAHGGGDARPGAEHDPHRPEVGETALTAAMLAHLGMGVERRDGEITVVPGDVADPHVPKAFTGLNRIPILVLGPLLHRAGEAFVPLVGGDPIGRRPVNFHVDALRGVHHIERGYHRPVEQFRALGLHLRRR